VTEYPSFGAPVQGKAALDFHAWNGDFLKTSMSPTHAGKEGQPFTHNAPGNLYFF